jgi:hypothetical protein
MFATFGGPDLNSSVSGQQTDCAVLLVIVDKYILLDWNGLLQASDAVSGTASADREAIV